MGLHRITVGKRLRAYEGSGLPELFRLNSDNMPRKKIILQGIHPVSKIRMESEFLFFILSFQAQQEIFQDFSHSFGITGYRNFTGMIYILFTAIWFGPQMP